MDSLSADARDSLAAMESLSAARIVVEVDSLAAVLSLVAMESLSAARNVVEVESLCVNESAMTWPQFNTVKYNIASYNII